MRKNILVTPLVAVLAVGASGMYASAQDMTSAVLTGTVTDPDGKPLSGVRVYLTSGALLTPRDGRTDAQGKFNFRLLPPGRYTITYSMDGFISRKAEMSLMAGVAANGDIRLRAMDVQGAAIEIVAEVSNVITPDKTDSAVQTAFTTDRLEEIGGGRGIAALTDLTPGLNGRIASSTPRSSTYFNIRGGIGSGNKIIQDGQVVNDALRGTYFNSGDTIEDLIESVAVIQSPLNAKLGNTDGGIISITTKRGGNNFSGSLRYGGTRGDGFASSTNAWRTTQVSYPDARGAVDGANSRPGGDMFNKSWQYSLTGPIIPNYLTFALGGNLTPYKSEGNPWGTSGLGPSWAGSNWDNLGWGNAANRYQRTLGTFYLDNDPNSHGYGDVIRKSYWGEANGPNAMRYVRSYGDSNTFNLYLQVTPNHQFTWYYTQSKDFSNSGSILIENPPDAGNEMKNISWNVSYKAVLGASGVFDARFGKSSSTTDYIKRGNNSVELMMYRSYVAMGDENVDWYYGSWDKIAMTGGTPGGGVAGTGGSGWVSDGMIGTAWNVFASNWIGAANVYSIGEDVSGVAGSNIISANANYQHMLDFKGGHIIDLGWNMNQVDAPGLPGGAKFLASPVGRIATGDQLDNYHIGNMFSGSYAGGNGRLGANYYADNFPTGAYIVFDVGTTTIGQLEPHALRKNYAGTMLNDGLIWNPSVFNQSTGTWTPGYLHSQLNGILSRNYMPFMRERWGSDVGDMRTTTSSVYANDMWTIDEHHSVMLGLRADIFSLKDSARTVHSYTKITPRLEYKFDLNGDQRHLFAASLAQFHQMAAANLYWPFIEKKWGNTSQRFWTGAALSDPTLRKSGYYLVGYNDLMNPANYTDEFASELSGRLFGDVDKNFRPPTSTELSLWYRHTFPSGGSFKVSFNNRSWSDMYEMFPSDVFAYDNPNTAVIEKTPRIKAVLKNTNDYTRTYTGVELQWDFPITRKVSFGGNYTFSRFFHDQTQIGSGESYQEGGSVTATGVTLQTPWWFDEIFSRDVVDASGNFLYNFGGRKAWSPMRMQGNEFALAYYLIVNLTQGKARSNFTLRGTYTGGTTSYDTVPIETGRYVMPPGPDGITYNTLPGQNPTPTQLITNMAVYLGQYTNNDTFANHFTYNLNMPIAKRLSWFLNINVTNFFHHQPYTSSVPGGNVGTSGSTLQPWGVPGASYSAQLWTTPRPGYPALRNPFVDGWNMDTTNVGGRTGGRYFFKQQSAVRTLTMSTGIRF